MDWPAPNDPFNNANPEANAARKSFYGINGVPAFRLNGQAGGYPSDGSLAAAIAGQLNQETPYNISAFADVQGTDVHIWVDVTYDEATPDRTKLFVALTQEFVHWDPPLPQYSNGVADWEYPMVNVNNTGNGEEVSSEGNGETIRYHYVFPLNSDYAIDNLAFISVLQNARTKDVLQADFLKFDTTLPSIAFDGFGISDATGNSNGAAEQGETVDFLISLRNHPDFATATNVTGTLACSDETLQITDATCTWPDITATAVNNSDDVLSIVVPEDYVTNRVEFSIAIDNGAGYVREYTFEEIIGRPDFLIVNDHGEAESALSTWNDIFDRANKIQAVVTPEDLAANNTLNDYPFVIWATANDGETVISEDEQTLISGYLNNGGKMILTGENIGDDLGDSPWFAQYFGVAGEHDLCPEMSRIRVVGDPEGPIADVDLALGGSGSAMNCTDQGTLTLQTGAVSLLKYYMTDYVAAAGFAGENFNTIVMAFNLEAVTPEIGLMDPEILMDYCFAWLEDTNWSDIRDVEATLPTSVELSAYPNPFNPTTSIRYALPTSGHVSLNVYDILGRNVATLLQQEVAAGQHNVSFDASNLTSGVYFLRLSTNQGTQTQKLMLLK